MNRSASANIFKRLGCIEELNEKDSALYYPNIEVYGLLISKPTHWNFKRIEERIERS